MIQEVRTLNPELQLLGFCDLEVLIDTQVTVKVGRRMQIRPVECAKLTLSRHSEAVRVEVLVTCASTARIAGDQRKHCGIAATGQAGHRYGQTNPKGTSLKPRLCSFCPASHRGRERST